MAAFVRETKDGWDVVEGEKSTAYTDADEALTSALRSIRGARTKAPIFHDPTTKRPNGAWRWFDAAAEEPTAVRGARHDATTVRDLVESLNALAIARPIDGGPGSSEHGTELNGSDTLANGWAHWAVLVVRSDGTEHAATLAEVHPDIVPETDSGRLAFLSIATGIGSLTDDGAIRGGSWRSASFTNRPANHALSPTPAMRSEGAPEGVAVRSHRLDAYARRTETTMSTETKPAPVPAAPAEVAKRAEIDPAVMAAVEAAMAAGMSAEDIVKALTPKPAEEPAMESEAATRSEKALEERLVVLEAKAERVAMRSQVDGALAAAKATMPDEERDALVVDLLATRSESLRKRLMTLSVKTAIGAPPATRELPAVRSGDPEADTSDVTDVAIRAELPAIEAAFPKEPAHMKWARARKAALAKKNGR